MWLHHYVNILQHTSGFNCYFIDYDQLINNPASVLGKLYSFINQHVYLDQTTATENSTTLVTKKLRHHTRRDSTLCPPHAVLLYNALCTSSQVESTCDELSKVVKDAELYLKESDDELRKQDELMHIGPGTSHRGFELINPKYKIQFRKKL